MKLLRYRRKSEPNALARLGVMVGDELVADLRAGHALFLAEEKGSAKSEELATIFMPPYLTQFLHLGEPGWEALAETHAWMHEVARSDREAIGRRGEALFIPLEQCRLYAPLRPSKLIAVEGNYAPTRGRAGSISSGAPNAVIKALSSIVGPGRDILRPQGLGPLGCEIELGIVIGQRCKHVAPEDVHEVIAGYTIVNDVRAGAARDADGHQALLDSSLDTFTPLGPWLVTRDEIADPMHLTLRTRVNGTLYQEGNTSAMRYSVGDLVVHLSRMTLMPGDVIATGSPAPLEHTSRRGLEAGDVIEAEIERIGVLRNAVVDEPR